ncbi:YfkD family protein [Aquibacillus koreensis]|uniref:YfkD family protein n=1 Tax=Aquibacillus koreensis TaxID=279446 RepID=A0A9X3WN91_9BACI|nr:YfkD famly protein [Aquibacillus koreensis]MCT2534421.1 YfkD family protein [Aquibacillus koreensis]MDC3421728.1 YfkD family protein [Aquibacillus koreensis]
MKKIIVMFIALMLCIVTPLSIYAKEEVPSKSTDNDEIPSHVLNISKENTYPNSTKDETILEPSDLVEELIEEAEVDIENPELIKMLNESSLKPSPIAIGYRGMIYMGHWPLSYESKETNINWEYQKINANELNNIGGNNQKTMSYNQLEEKHIKGGLTAKINRPDQIKKLMILNAKQNTELPLSFHTVVGKGTKMDNTYAIPVKKMGYLNAFAPAVSEKGTVTFGEVYIKLKGSKKEIVVKNVTKQGIGAWIPIQDHVSFSFKLK